MPPNLPDNATLTAPTEQPQAPLHSSGIPPGSPPSHWDGNPPARPLLGLWDAVGLILGIVIASGIYRTPSIVFAKVATPWMAVAIWGFGGLLSMIGALCYAELATTYRRSGGEYHYLTRAFGPHAGFLFGWCQLLIVQTTSMGALAYIFGEHAVLGFGLANDQIAILALAAVGGLTLLNLLGLVVSKWAINVLVVAKLVGIVALILAGALYPAGPETVSARPTSDQSFGMAMIFVLYAFGGWNDAAFVAAEVKDGKRNIPRALIIGLGLVTLLYVGLNAAYLNGLGFEGTRREQAPAAALFRILFPAGGERAICILVMLSTLGGLNGLLFSASRVHSATGAEHRLVGFLGWGTRSGIPVMSLLAQGAITCLLIVVVGSEIGRAMTDTILGQCKLAPIPWDMYGGGLETLVAGGAPVFWASLLVTGLALFALRQRDPKIERPYSVPGYPLVPLIFCATCTWMLWASVDYSKPLLPFTLTLVAVGALLSSCSIYRPKMYEG